MLPQVLAVAVVATHLPQRMGQSPDSRCPTVELQTPCRLGKDPTTAFIQCFTTLLLLVVLVVVVVVLLQLCNNGTIIIIISSSLKMVESSTIYFDQIT